MSALFVAPSKVAAEAGGGGPFDTVAGLPVHPLVVHAAVVLLPLTAIGLVAIVVVPRWRRSAFGWLVMGGLVVATGACFVAKESGEALADRVGNPAEHAQLGDQLPIMAGVMLVAASVWFALARRDDRAGVTRTTATTILGAAAVVLAALNLVWVVRVGHSGAAAVWAAEIEATTQSDGSAQSGTYTMADVQAHGTSTDCWTTIDGTVYDVSGYSSTHPGGASHIDQLCGTDGTGSFTGQHAGEPKPSTILKGFEIGTLAEATSPSASPATSSAAAGAQTESTSPSPGTYTMAVVKSHNTADDCWTVVESTVYDVSGYASKHPGGASHIDNMCGTDATSYFEDQHSGQGRPEDILAGMAIGALG